MIAPLLPGAEELAENLDGMVDFVIFDRMNYHYADWVYRQYKLTQYQSQAYYLETRRRLEGTFRKNGIEG
jgi:hypothetical protein